MAYMNGTFMVYEPDGKIIPKDETQVKGPPKESFKIMEEKYGEAFRTWWAPQTRIKDMDRYGWDIQVLLPTGSNGNFGCSVALKDADLGAAFCRAYNNWAHDYCSADSKRLKFIAVVPGANVEEIVKEARRAVAELGAVSIRNPLLPQGKWLHEKEYDALWRLACELDFPIAVHGEYRYRVQPFRGFRVVEQSGTSSDEVHDFQACGESIMRSDFLATTWRPWAILFLPEYWSDFPNCVLRFSNPMPAGCPSGLAGWTCTRTDATASWASQNKYPCCRANISSANARWLATAMRLRWRVRSII